MTRITPTTALALRELLSPGLLLSLALTLPLPAVAQTTAPPILVATQAVDAGGRLPRYSDSR